MRTGLALARRFPTVAVVAVVVFTGCSSSPRGDGASRTTGGATGAGGALGGSGGGAPSCASLPPLPKIRLCAPAFAPKDATSMLEGPVLQTGSGVGAENCPPSEGGVDADAYWFELADAQSTVWRFGVSLPGAVNPVVVGQSVRVRYRRTEGSFTTIPLRELTLLSKEDQLLAYLVVGSDLDDLQLPDGIYAERGAAVCTSVEECVQWSAYELDFTTNGSAKGTLQPGASQVIGAYRFVHGEHWRLVGPLCPNSDHFPSSIVLGISPVAAAN